MTEHESTVAVADTESSPKAAILAGQTHSSRGWWFMALVVVAGSGLAAFAWTHSAKKAVAAEGPEGHDSASARIRVEVAHPVQGGLERTTTQAGSVHAFEHARLYAKVSGYLKVQNVDIGDTVKQGQVLAEVDVPELLKAVDQAAASLDQAKAKVKQSAAKIKSAEADREAAAAQVRQSQAEVETQNAKLSYRKKEFDRIKSLVARQAVEQKLADEQLDQYEATIAAKHVAEATVLTSKAQESAMAAKIDQAQADLAESQANVEVAEADLAKAKVMADYMRIISPYDGVVTLRSYHRGDFVRSAAEGGAVPILAVARIDHMRVVLPVPDRDVPFVNRGDPATVRIDALPGREFHGVVSRFAESEDPESRNMRTEVDLPNDDAVLRDGMYGRVTILLEPAAKRSVTIPSSSLIEQSGSGEGAVYVVRDGKAVRVKIHVGKDNGLLAEINTGLSAADSVIIRYNGAIANGSEVTAEAALPTAKVSH